MLAPLAGQASDVIVRPNIVLFFVDDMGWNDWGGRNSLFETPSIDSLARESVNFEQCYIPTPTSSPSRATLLTGKHPARLKMVRHVPDLDTAEYHILTTDPAGFPSRNFLPLSETTIAELLREEGYYNLHVGKWHIGDHQYYPTSQGFDRMVGISQQGAPNSYFPSYFRDTSVYTDHKGQYLTDKLTQEAVDFIEQCGGDQPFFMNFWHYGVHSPVEAKAADVEHFMAKGVTRKYATYMAMMRSVDESLGAICRALRSRGLDQNTVIIFLSDQGGDFSNAPLRGGKNESTLSEGGARVPLLVRMPGVATRRESTPVQSTDIFATIAQMVGGNKTGTDGVSLLELITKEKKLKPRDMFGYRAYENQYASIRRGSHKLVANRDGSYELYNLDTDPSEQLNIAHEQQKMSQELLHSLFLWEVEMGVEQYSGINKLAPPSTKSTN